MRGIRLAEEIAVQEFAKRAAKRFAKDKNINTYTDDKIFAGCYFAIRWGLDKDCVLVFRLDEDFEPINYHQLIGDII